MNVCAVSWSIQMISRVGSSRAFFIFLNLGKGIGLIVQQF